jgi:hypothetical protein
MGPVGGGGDARGVGQPVHHSPIPVLVDIHEGECPGGRVAREAGHGVVVGARNVDVGPVGGDRDAPGVGQPVDSPLPVPILLHEGERPGGRVAREGRHGAVTHSRDVDVGPVGGDRDAPGAVQPVHAPHSVLVEIDEGQRAEHGVRHAGGQSKD